MLIENLIFWRRLQKGCEEVWLFRGQLGGEPLDIYIKRDWEKFSRFIASEVGDGTRFSF